MKDINRSQDWLVQFGYDCIEVKQSKYTCDMNKMKHKNLQNNSSQQFKDSSYTFLRNFFKRQYCSFGNILVIEISDIM